MNEGAKKLLGITDEVADQHRRILLNHTMLGEYCQTDPLLGSYFIGDDKYISPEELVCCWVGLKQQPEGSANLYNPTQIAYAAGLLDESINPRKLATCDAVQAMKKTAIPVACDMWGVKDVNELQKLVDSSADTKELWDRVQAKVQQMAGVNSPAPKNTKAN